MATATIARARQAGRFRIRSQPVFTVAFRRSGRTGEYPGVHRGETARERPDVPVPDTGTTDRSEKEFELTERHWFHSPHPPPGCRGRAMHIHPARQLAVNVECALKLRVNQPRLQAQPVGRLVSSASGRVRARLDQAQRLVEPRRNGPPGSCSGFLRGGRPAWLPGPEVQHVSSGGGG